MILWIKTDTRVMAKVEGTSEEVEETIEVEEENRSIIYGITDLPPVHLGILCALQQLAMTLSAVLAVPIIITQIMGTPYQNDPDKQKELLNLRAQLVGITVFCCGVATLLQIIFGIRLPLIQGSSYTFIPVITTVINTTRDNTPPPGRTIFEAQLCELAGSLMVASSLQILLGATGAVGLLSRFIGPLSIAPILALISLGFVDTLANNCSHQWGIAGMTAGLIIIFSELLRCRIPIPSWSRGENCHSVKLPVFQILPVFLALVITWTFSAILTATNVFPNNSTHPNYLARTDAKASTLETTDWITLPYPGKWGLPTVSLAGSVGMIVATMSSIVESVGDYYAAAAICRVPPPPAHAINRFNCVKPGANHDTWNRNNPRRISCFFPRPSTSRQQKRPWHGHVARNWQKTIIQRGGRTRAQNIRLLHMLSKSSVFQILTFHAYF